MGHAATTFPEPYGEPLRATLVRTITIAVVGGAVVSSWGGGLAGWPVATLLLLWPSFGGHWVELAFLNVLRPRLPRGTAVRAVARLAVWFVGGAVLLLGMRLTAALVGLRPTYRPAWWLGGLGFVAVELLVHLVFLALGRPSFYDGRG